MEVDRHSINKFFMENNIKVVNEKRGIVSQRQNEFFTDPSNANFVVDSRAPYNSSEKIFVVEMPESALQHLIMLDNRFYARTNNDDRTAKLMVEKERQEQVLREKYPAVQSAWEQYSLMLHLSSQSDKNS
jgi:hypothetical protein